MVLGLYWRAKDKATGASHHVAGAVLPRHRSPGQHDHLVPAVLALPRRRHGRHRALAVPAVLPPQFARRTSLTAGWRVSAVGLLPQLPRRWLQRRPVPAGVLRLEAGARPRGPVPAVLALSRRSRHHHGGGPVLLPLRRQAEHHHRGAAAALLLRPAAPQRRRRQQHRRHHPRAVPAVLALRQRQDRGHHHRHPAVLLAQRRRGLVGRVVPAAVRRQLDRPQPLRAGAAAVALPRPEGRQEHHRRAELPAPPPGRRGHRRAIPAAALPPRRQAGRAARDQLHPVPAGCTTAATSKAGSSSRPSPPAGRPPTARPGSSRPTSGTKARPSRPAACRCCTWI